MADPKLEAKYKELGDLIDAEARTAATGHYAWFASTCEELCESPIERLFLMAWSVFLFRHEYNKDGFGLKCDHWLANYASDSKEVRRFDDPWSIPGHHFPNHLDIIQVQPRVGKYRPDFVLQRFLRPHCEDRSAIIRTPMTIVECDGHDYHEKTKEQAQHDKERDRFLQSEGFVVFRFTGSEIWKDPKGCAGQVELFLEQQCCDQMGLAKPKHYFSESFV